MFPSLSFLWSKWLFPALLSKLSLPIPTPGSPLGLSSEIFAMNRVMFVSGKP